VNEEAASVTATADGLAIGAADVAALLQRSLEEIAAGLECVRLFVLAYSESDGLLRGARVVGVAMPGIRDLRLNLSEFPVADQALRTRQIRPFSHSALPPALQPLLNGSLIAIPLVTGERRLAVMIGQLAPGISIRSAAWQERAEQLTVRATLNAEIAGLSAAYQDERKLRQATQAIIAAILEGRPLSEIAGIIAEQTAERLGEERIGLYLYGADGAYSAAALRNVSAEYAEDMARLRRHSPFSKRALATHLPYFTPDAQSDPQVTPALRALFEREGIRGVLIAVLQHGDDIRGALVVYPRGERRFTPREMSVFQTLADQAALAVSIAQQIERQRDTATAEERNRLARELHDTVAQSLAGVLMQVDTAETYLSAGDYATAGAMLASARAQARRALEDTRRAVQGLAPPTLDNASLADALTDEARQFAADAGIEAPFVTTGAEQPLTADQRLALLRIAQEALNNARKHSRARRVRIGLQYGAESVALVVDDDGEGFDVGARTSPAASGGYGLFGMEERARLLGGDLQIESTPGWGTRIRAVIPYRLHGELPRRMAPAPAARPPSPRPAQIAEAGGPPLRVLIADDHAIVRQGLRDILEAQGLVVVGEAENGAQAAARAEELRPDVVLMDLQMPEVDGLEGLRRLHGALPDMPAIVLTTFETEGAIGQALSAGARGYLMKDTAPEQLVAAIHSVHRGESQFSSSITERLASRASGRSTEAPLNEREQEVLERLARGARNKEIAAELYITVSTVEKHVAGLFGKLGVSNRAEAARIAVERGLVSPIARP